MKKGIGYIRISTKDQSNFSLEDQAQKINDYAISNEIVIVEIFKDDGFSAKTFDRPDWNKLEDFIKKYHREISLLIVSSYTRFSRNLTQALQKLENLEMQYGIRVISVMEPIGIHPKNPFFFKLRTDILTNAQLEWLIIKDRTKSGIRRANLNGRWVNGAPFGFIRIRDAQNKPVLKANEATAWIVREMFMDFLNGAPLHEVYINAKRKGYTPVGNGVVKVTLTNCLYAGLIRVKEYYDEPEQYVKALHEPIIEEDIFWQVQQLLKPTGKTKHLLHESFPLRGILWCEFYDKLLTAAFSKGKTKRIGYYFCTHHRNHNFNADKVHNLLEMLFNELSLSQVYIDYLRGTILKLLNQKEAEKDSIINAKSIELSNLKRKQRALEERYIEPGSVLDRETYLKWRNQYAIEETQINALIFQYNQPMQKIWKLFEEQFPKLTNLLFIYQQADLLKKQEMIRLVFDNSLCYMNGTFRTRYLLPMFAMKAPMLAEKKLLIIEQPVENVEKIGIVPSTLQFSNYTAFLNLISQITKKSA